MACAGGLLDELKWGILVEDDHKIHRGKRAKQKGPIFLVVYWSFCALETFYRCIAVDTNYENIPL